MNGRGGEKNDEVTFWCVELCGEQPFLLRSHLRVGTISKKKSGKNRFPSKPLVIVGHLEGGRCVRWRGEREECCKN